LTVLHQEHVASNSGCKAFMHLWLTLVCRWCCELVAAIADVSMQTL